MRYDPEGLIPAEGTHIGIAVALDDGLLVPVLRDADAKEVAVISRERAALQEGARAGKLPVDALVGAVFTISNLGQHGVDRFTAIVNPPEAAILAVGRVRDLVVARDGMVVVAPVVTLTLSVDHRVADGAQAAAFLADLAGRVSSGMR
jgi:pyruvate dehydrogenase E2 component (dihydrolipoamide acetyltransferase)